MVNEGWSCHFETGPESPGKIQAGWFLNLRIKLNTSNVNAPVAMGGTVEVDNTGLTMG